MRETNFDRLIKSRLTLANVRITAASRSGLAAIVVEKAGIAERLTAMTDEEIRGLLNVKKSKAKTVSMVSFRPTDHEDNVIAKLTLMFDGLSASEVIRIVLHEAATDTRRAAIMPQVPPQIQVDKITQALTRFVQVFEEARKGSWAASRAGGGAERSALEARVEKVANAVLDEVVPLLVSVRMILAFINGLKPLDSETIDLLGRYAENLFETRDEARRKIERNDDLDGGAQYFDKVASAVLRLLYRAGLHGTTNPDEPVNSGDPVQHRSLVCKPIRPEPPASSHC